MSRRDGRGAMGRKLAPFRAAEVPPTSHAASTSGWTRTRSAGRRGGGRRPARSTGPFPLPAEVPVSKILDRVADAGGILFVLLVGVGYIALVAPLMPESLDSPDAVVGAPAGPPADDARSGSASGWRAPGWRCSSCSPPGSPARIRAADPAGWLPSAVVGLAVAAFDGQDRLVRPGARRPARRPLRRRHGHRAARASTTPPSTSAGRSTARSCCCSASARSRPGRCPAWLAGLAVGRRARRSSSGSPSPRRSTPCSWCSCSGCWRPAAGCWPAGRRTVPAPAPRTRVRLTSAQLPRPASRARIIASARSATCSLAKIADT